MRRVAAMILAIGGFLLVATWQHDGKPSSWTWQHLNSYDLSWMTPLEFALKIAGLGLIAAALLAWPPRKTV